MKTSEWLILRESAKSSELERKTLEASVGGDLWKVSNERVMSGWAELRSRAAGCEACGDAERDAPGQLVIYHRDGLKTQEGIGLATGAIPRGWQRTFVGCKALTAQRPMRPQTVRRLRKIRTGNAERVPTSDEFGGVYGWETP